MSLIYCKDKTLRMHDLIRDMGREIVRAESPMELGKRSRLWNIEDAKSVLRNESVSTFTIKRYYVKYM